MLHSRLMHYIDHVARYGSIRKAAEKLNVSSSSINRQILAYEAELGLDLFERLPRGVRLTAMGELLVEHIRGTLKAHDRMLSRIDGMRGLRWTTITMATLEALQSDVIAQVTARFIERYPQTRFEIQSVPAERIVAQVMEGAAMLGLGFDVDLEPGAEALASVPFRLGVVVGPKHPLAAHRSMRLSDCVGHAFALPSPPLELRAIIQTMLTAGKVTLHAVTETNSIDLLKSLASTADIATFLTLADVDLDRRKGDLVFIPLAFHGSESQMLHLIRRRSAVLPPAAEIFAKDLTAFVQSMGDP